MDSLVDGNLMPCPGCQRPMRAADIPHHLDKDCSSALCHRSPSTSQISRGDLAPIFQKKRPHPDSLPGVVAASQDSSSYNTIDEGASQKKRSKPSTIDARPCPSQATPLADRLRPRTLNDFVGQDHLLGPGSAFRAQIKAGTLPSVILWGPPGTGKTTLARLIASETGVSFREVSATNGSVTDVRKIVDEASKPFASLRGRTILFLDEIHRFNRAQQDILLPHVEKGTIQLIGATTENPSFKIISPLLSRCRVFTLKALEQSQIETILERSVSFFTTRRPSPAEESSPTDGPQEDTCHQPSMFSNLTKDILSFIASVSAGDARVAISLTEFVAHSPPQDDLKSFLAQLKESVVVSYDRVGEAHYDSISALHKSVRGSDADGALFWLARMLLDGEDPLFIARRLVVMASEDIGLANEMALPMATATLTACQNIGMPECRINLAHCVTYFAESKKSTRSYMAFQRAEAAARKYRDLPVPLNMRNAPTKLMRDLGYSEGYNYNPAYRHPVHNDFLPPEISHEKFLYDSSADNESKEWNEDLLTKWERLDNDGKTWEGRRD